MAAPAPGTLLLFVASEPGPGPASLPSQKLFSFARASGAFLPPILFLGSYDRSPPPGTPASGDPDGPTGRHLSPETIDCANLVLVLAERAGQQVALVELDGSPGSGPLADRWVRPRDLLPVLVRPDGARLVGPEYFTPARVRQFLAGR